MLPQGPLSSWVAKMNMLRTLLLSANSRPSGCLHILIWFILSRISPMPNWAAAANPVQGPACQRLCLQGLPWAVRAGGSAVLISSDTAITSGCKMRQISVKLWLWGITEQHSLFSFRVRKYFTENLQVSLCGAQVQSPENLRWRIMLALGVQDM